MKATIHPQYFDNCAVTCACGNKFTTGSTVEKIEVEVCSKCHPFFTGTQKFVNIKGRIDKFREKQAQGTAYKAKKLAKKSDKTKKIEKEKLN
ncbi:50S ribosomal protein L31 [Candidatus Shapirobacteria bacterium CG06_land_8_20_14_3_00_40_12]|uniref:Large ribosomal subunit protein bL31 n=2 Tax=Candidatus Shapironibacteriota TaxID=1752721 RepID=A0A2M7TTR9_9BACT|nr:MAG: 50S ribosomal protein L31 [Candidatus Shapirobacteria bacterium CG06_land_8_20_14_3_00_40_12]PIZ60522.1 MAG: 50S ribosomal protein L31 [Candidatus Shapirobacteria bacterium CG_4_10_14_0_2_um_filter_40_12]